MEQQRHWPADSERQSQDSMRVWGLQASLCPLSVQLEGGRPLHVRPEMSSSPRDLGPDVCAQGAVGTMEQLLPRSQKVSLQSHLGLLGGGGGGRLQASAPPRPPERLTDDLGSFAPPHLATPPHRVTRSDLEKAGVGRGGSSSGTRVHTPLIKVGL